MPVSIYPCSVNKTPQEIFKSQIRDKIFPVIISIILLNIPLALLTGNPFAIILFINACFPFFWGILLICIIVLLSEIKNGYIVAVGADDENLYIIKYALSEKKQTPIPFDQITDIHFDIYAQNNLDKLFFKKIDEVSKKNETINKIFPKTDLIAKIKTDENSYRIQIQQKSPAHLFLTNLSQTLPNM